MTASTEAQATTCAQCPKPATTTRLMAIRPGPDTPTAALCDSCATGWDRDVWDEIYDRAKEWSA